MQRYYPSHSGYAKLRALLIIIPKMADLYRGRIGYFELSWLN
jgi:hypothetical protein